MCCSSSRCPCPPCGGKGGPARATQAWETEPGARHREKTLPLERDRSLRETCYLQLSAARQREMAAVDAPEAVRRQQPAEGYCQRVVCRVRDL
jgi:hypothetical protein